VVNDEPSGEQTKDPPAAEPRAPLAAASTTRGAARNSRGLLTTGDMARLAGSTLRTVRFYEEAGLLTVVRNEGGHRLFDEASLHKLRLATDLRAAGLSLQEIKELFELKAQCTSSAEASARIADRLGGRIDEMQQTIALLRRLREELASSVAVIEECAHCTNKCKFPERCTTCEVLARKDLPRAARILWSI
jgi:DNA-binding transcriptional MerR regulator